MALAVDADAQEVFKDRLVAIRQLDRPLRVLRVTELRMESQFVITFNEDGNRGAWQREFVLGHAPVCTVALLQGGRGRTCRGAG
ncbi:MAG: hypothetical protein HC901_01965 [Bdellovibrionaceae bacterium]|nr:hypothetical protein [Pseudobdellovibrionaceae bacterium]